MKNWVKIIGYLCLSVFSVLVIFTQVTKIIDKPFKYSIQTSNGSLKTSINFGTSGIQITITDPKKHQTEHSKKESLNSKEKPPPIQELTSSVQMIKDFVLKKLLISSSPLIVLNESRDELFKALLFNFQQNIEQQSDKKLKWMIELNHYLRFLCLLPLLFLLIPWFVYRQSTQSIQRFFRVIPFSLVMTASCMAILVWLLDLLYSLQALQIYLGILLVPTNTIHLDALLALKYAPLEPLLDSMKLYLLDGMNWKSSLGYTDPLGTLSLIYAQMSDSSSLSFVKYMVNLSSELSALYGPFTACVSLILIYIVFKPMIKELLLYPMSIIDDQMDIKNSSPFTYLKQVLKMAWIELRAFFITTLYALLMFVILFAIQLLTSAVAGVSLLALSVWMSELLSLNAVVPEFLVLFTLIVTILFVLFFNLSLIVTLSFGVRGFYLIARDKFKRKVYFRTYPMLTQMISFIFKSVIPKLLLQLVMVSGLCMIVLYVQCTQVTSVFLLGMVICIPTGLFWYHLPPTSGLMALYKSDLLDRSVKERIQSATTS